MTAERDRLLGAAESVMRQLRSAQALVRDGQIRAAAKTLIGAAIELTTLSLRAEQLGREPRAEKPAPKLPEPN